MAQQNFCTGNHILVGLGGTGGKILKAFKMRMFEEYPTSSERAQLPVALLYVDSTDEMMPKNGVPRPDFRVMGQDASFSPDEFLNIKAVDINYILDHIDNYPSIKGIVENAEKVKLAIGALGQAAGQMRRAGRLLFAVNAGAYNKALKNALAKCVAQSKDETKKYIHIFAGLCGGTGSGSVIDAIVQARKTFPDAVILVYAMIPELNLPKTNMDQGRYYPNGYAAVNELNALQTGRFKPQDVTGTGKADLFDYGRKGVADGITLYSNVNENGMTVNSLQELPRIVADYLYTRIFFINEGDEKFGDIIRAYNFENMDQFAVEYDEGEEPDAKGIVPIARTKKVNSIGIKRVIYPELRVIKHITYTVGENVLYQFKYNNWREGEGFVNCEKNKDYRSLYLNDDQLQKWMLDQSHLMLDRKILDSDPNYQTFNDYWHDKAISYAEDAKSASCPLNELDNLLGEFFTNRFRGDGVIAFFANKERAVSEMSKEIRHHIESDLYEKWKTGDISIVELMKVSKLLIEKVGELRLDIEGAIAKEKETYEAIDGERSDNVTDWNRLGILQRMVGIGARRYAEHQDILAEYYESKTRLIALEFAKKLAARVSVDIGKLDADILSFSQKINDAIEETEKLVSAQQKVNKGLEDMKGAIIEVSEEESMVAFESDIRTDKLEMPNIARRIRERILPKGEFINFGVLSDNIYVDDIKDAFDTGLSITVKEIHDNKADSDKKVLGLNILSQLQQQLTTDEEISTFAFQLVKQSGVYLKLDANQMKLHLRNNEGDLSPTNPASINKKVIVVSIPSVENANDGVKRFAKKLIEAIRKQFGNNDSQGEVQINDQSPRLDELSIVTMQYCFPMRAAEWLNTYRKRYDQFLNSGNASSDAKNSILLHSEGDGKDMPNFFPLSDEAIAAKIAQREQARQSAALNSQSVQAAPQPSSGFATQMGTPNQAQPASAMPPAMPSAAVPPPIMPQPDIKLFIAVNGQQYGPFNMEQCRQMVQSRQLIPQSLVWKEGMASWMQASQVPELQTLFQPAAAPGMPPMPTPPPVM